MKRLYKEVTNTGTQIALDGKPLKTPGRRVLEVPSAALAAAIAAEWAAQGEQVVPSKMPLTQLAATALDRVGPERAAIEQGVLRYAETDLVCYRAEEPIELARRQQAAWQPLLDWLDRRWNVRLNVARGIMPAAQDPDMLARLGQAIQQMDDWRLSALQVATAATGSVVVAMALVAGRIGAAQAFAVAELDESFQIEQWGEDPIATERREALALDLDAVRLFLDLLGETSAMGRGA